MREDGNSNQSIAPLLTKSFQSKEKIEKARVALLEAVLRGKGDTWLPTDYCVKEGESPRSVIGECLCDIYKVKHRNPKVAPPYSGLICMDTQMNKAAVGLNQAKVGFKRAITSLRRAIGNVSEFQSLLGSIGLQGYDLVKAYRQIPILPFNIEVISWSWIKSGEKVEEVQVEQLYGLIKDTVHDYNTGNEIKKALSRYPNEEKLVRVYVSSIQLRAFAKSKIRGEGASKSLVSSGPILLNQKALPECILWREKPSKDDGGVVVKPRRKPRMDKYSGLVCEIGGSKIYESKECS